jgi:hypothetical protein
MFFDPQSQPDWYQRPVVLKKAMQEVKRTRGLEPRIWMTGAALTVILLAAILAASLF